MTPQGSSPAMSQVGGSPVRTQPIARSMGNGAGKLGHQLATGNAGTPMAPGGSMGGAAAKLGGNLGGGTPMYDNHAGMAGGAPAAQGFAGMTASQSGNPNVGGFGGAGLNAEVTNPGMGFLSGLFSGSNI